VDLGWAEGLLTDELGGRMQARRGELIDVLDADGLVALRAAQPVGIITWGREQGGSAEIACLAVASAARRRGIGRALLTAAADALRRRGVGRTWLVTTNDNHAALALYAQVGYRLAAVRPGAIDELRRTIKPSIPEVSPNGIPIHDELELERLL
jgi:ribosomal protein S18 acetylase RimI-like enzyme